VLEATGNVDELVQSGVSGFDVVFHAYECLGLFVEFLSGLNTLGVVLTPLGHI
jgi:hypothetical protein